MNDIPIRPTKRTDTRQPAGPEPAAAQNAEQQRPASSPPALGVRATAMVRSSLIWVALTSVLICTTLSIMGIWEVFGGDTDTVWRAVATLGVIIFGCVIAAAVTSVGNREIDPILSR